MPRAFHLPPPGLAEDQPAADIPLKDLPPVAKHTEEPLALALSVPTSIPPVPPTTALVPSIPSKPSAPMPTAHSDIAGSSTSAPPQ